MHDPPAYDVGALPGDWFDCRETGDAQRFEDELRRQMAAGHQLESEDLVCVAWRRHMKDTVFWLPSRQQWATIHLTWTVEADPRWPRPSFHDTWKGVVADWRDDSYVDGL